MNFKKKEKLIEILLTTILGSSIIVIAIFIIFDFKGYLPTGIFLFFLGMFLNIVYRYAKKL